ncbi:DUF4286 family protein [Chloroflexota bacterium]
MAKKKVIHIIGVECPPELEDKFNKWYNEVHIPMAIKSAKFKKVTRYKAITTPATIKSEGMPTNYIALYEFDSREDFEEMFASELYAVDLIKDARETWPNWEEIRKFRVQYEAIQTWEV